MADIETLLARTRYFTEVAAPSTPAAGTAVMFLDTSDGILKWKDEAGTVYALDGSGGGGDVATDAIWDAAGDLAVGSGANTAARLAAGSEGEVLTIASGVPSWEAAGGITPAYSKGINASESVTNSEAKIPLDSEAFGSGVTFDNANDRLTIVTNGIYLIVATMDQSSTALTTTQYIGIYKNGSPFQHQEVPNKGSGACTVSVVDSAVATDYYEAWGFAASTVTWTGISLSVVRVG